MARKKKKSKSFLKKSIGKSVPIDTLFMMWVLSMAIFFLALYLLPDGLLPNSNIWLGVFFIDIIFGVITFIVILATLMNIFLKDKRDGLIKLLLTGILFSSFFLILLNFPFQEKSQTYNSTTKTAANTKVNKDNEDKKELPNYENNTQNTQYKNNNKVGEEDLWKVEKIDDKTTDSRFPADERMGTSEELFVAINNYRSAHAIPQVHKHDTLCNIAQIRANQLFDLGELDYHAGMDSLAHSQQDFDSMAEVISGGVQKELAVHTVEWGWGRSLTGHRESILNSKWTHGCGGVAGLFSVFVFGSN